MGRDKRGEESSGALQMGGSVTEICKEISGIALLRKSATSCVRGRTSRDCRGQEQHYPVALSICCCNVQICHVAFLVLKARLTAAWGVRGGIPPSIVLISREIIEQSALRDEQRGRNEPWGILAANQ